MADTTAARVRWTWEVGPAAVLSTIQIGVILGGGIWFYAKLDSTAENTAQTVRELKHSAERQGDRTNTINDRVTKVETQVGSLVASVARIETAVTRSR